MTNRNLVVCLTLAVAVVLTAGCTKPAQVVNKAPTPPLADTAAKAGDTGVAITKAAETATTNIDGATVGVNEVAGTVTTQAETLRQTTPAAEPVAKVLDVQAKTLQTQVAPKLHAAKEAVAEVSRQGAVVSSVIAPELKKADAAVQTLAKERDDWQVKTAAAEKRIENEKARTAAAEKRVEAEKAKATSTTQTVLTWLIVLGVLCVAGGVVLAIKGDPKLGLSICGGGLVLIGTCAFLKEYLGWIIWGSVALVAAVIAGIIYLLWQSRKAFFQTGNFVEAIKQQLDPESLKALFGDGAIPGLVHRIVDDTQSALYKLGVKTGVIKTAAVPPAAETPALPATAVPVKGGVNVGSSDDRPEMRRAAQGPAASVVPAPTAAPSG